MRASQFDASLTVDSDPEKYSLTNAPAKWFYGKLNNRFHKNSISKRLLKKGNFGDEIHFLAIDDVPKKLLFFSICNKNTK